MKNHSILKKYTIIVAGLILGMALTAQEKRLRVLFTGDIMGHDSQIASTLATGEPGYDYKPCFRYIRPYFQEADLVVGNLEVTLAGPPYKGYPHFSSPDELADALQWAGFDLLLTANNHALDREAAGLARTINQLDNRGLFHTGTFTGPEQRKRYYPLVLEKNGIRIALLNYTYGTNGLKVRPPFMINRIDTVLMRQDLQKAVTAGPDFIVVTMHWGDEYQINESHQQRKLASFLFRHGADAIIGSHPHVVQPIREDGNGHLVVYSMGNFISNQRERYRNGGIAVELELVKRADGTAIHSYNYLPVWVWKPVTKKGTVFTLVPAMMDPFSISEPEMSATDRGDMIRFLEDTRLRLGDVPMRSLH